MNIYMIQEEDGEILHVQAGHMQGAIEAAQQIFIKDNYDWLKDEDGTPDDYYQANVLLGCSLVGELKNPVPTRQSNA